MRVALPALLLLAAAGPPRGTPTPRPQPNRVVVKQSLLDAGGVAPRSLPASLPGKNAVA